MPHGREVTFCFTFRDLYNGQVGYSIYADWFEPLNPHVQADYDSRDRILQLTIGWFAGPLVFGDYPQSLKELYGDSLPTFNVDLSGQYDFIGLEHYTTYLVSCF